MPLPSVPLPSASVVIGTQTVAVRSLSRAETMHIKAISEDLEECEVYMLICGTGESREEVERFRNTSPPQHVEDLITAIAELSGFATTKGKANSVRAKSTNGHSSTKS